MKQIQILKKWLIVLAFCAIFAPILANASSIENSSDFSSLRDKFKKGTILLRKIESSLSGQTNLLKDAKKNIKETQLKLEATDKKIKTLKDQLLNLKNLTLESERKLLSIKRQIAERENELYILRETIARKRKDKNELLIQMQSFTRFNTFASESPDFGSLSVLLAFENLGQSMASNFFSDMAKNYFSSLADENERVSRELALTVDKLKEKKQNLEELKERLEAEVRNLQYHKEATKNILVTTKGEEDIYKKLLEESKKEQEETTKIITNLKENYAFVETKLNELKQNEILTSEISLEDFTDALRSIPLSSSAPLRWPVSPIRGISAYYQDLSYLKTIGIPHSAIDIKVPQETEIKAAQTGVVYKVRDEDEGYNYIILAHRDGLITLYGHITKANVEEGDTVFMGETIGLSGGIPATRGAGWLTTGAHVHFEVFKNWRHADPLEYLPLEFLPIEYVPQKYISKLTDTDNEKNKIERLQLKGVKRATAE